MKKLTVKSKRDYISAINGLFINPSISNKTGLAPREMDILTMLLDEMGGGVTITPEVKQSVADKIGKHVQIVTNYIGSLKKKNAILGDNRVNPVLIPGKILIQYEEV